MNSEAKQIEKLEYKAERGFCRAMQEMRGSGTSKLQLPESF